MTAPAPPPRVLAIAGWDPSGGAGIAADLKTVFALGGHGMAVVTAITAQNSLGVAGWWPVPVEVLRGQLEAVLADIGVDAVKIGMLGTVAVAQAVADLLAPVHAAGIPIVLDPVLATSRADPLVLPGVVAVMKERLLPLATVLTPNLPEAIALGGVEAVVEADLPRGATALLGLGPAWVLLKGGHLAGDAVDLLTDGATTHQLRAPRLTNPNTHGTGCSLASAIATGLARGLPVPAAVRAAKDYVFGAIAAGFAAGAGPGPVAHGWRGTAGFPTGGSASG